MTHFALKYIGRPWIAGAQGPDSFDCWGFVRYVLLHEFGHDVPPVNINPNNLRDVLQTHYLALRKKNGSLSGPFVVTPGALTTEVVLSEEPDIDILTGTDAERTHFAFGTADKWSVLARVTGIHPRSTKVEITAVIEDSRVHQ